MSEPTTEAGRALLADEWLTNPYGEAHEAMWAAVRAIEAEARANFAARLEARVKGLPAMPMVVGPWDGASTADAVLVPAVLAAIREDALPETEDDMGFPMTVRAADLAHEFAMKYGLLAPSPGMSYAEVRHLEAALTTYLEAALEPHFEVGADDG